ncbi:hypothetical protein BZG35_05855 [Brevundimonas sp. LM2]|nr:hypothetical protein BZG35_05855 [Brevundimonas sp. LM2]
MSPVPGVAPLVGGPTPRPETGRRLKPSPTLIAALACRRITDGPEHVILVTTSEARADDIGRVLAAMAGEAVEVMALPPWDCLPYDHASPSRESQGRRLLVLDRLERASGKVVLVVSPEAAMQRLPPRTASQASFDLRVGEPLDRDALKAFADRTGYVVDDRVDEPGEIAFLGEVIDLFPAAADRPVRASLVDERIETLKWYDPITQRTEDAIDRLTLQGASELHLSDDEIREPGIEHGLARVAGTLETLFERMDAATVLVEADAAQRCGRFLAQVAEAHETARVFGGADVAPAAPSALYLSELEADAALARGEAIDAGDVADPLPAFATERRPGKALAAYIQDQSIKGRRIVLSATAPELQAMRRLLARQTVDVPSSPSRWDEIVAAGSGSVSTFVADPSAGFDDADLDLTVLTATEVLGGRLGPSRTTAQILSGEIELRTGDVVIHEDHGLGVLTALERVTVGGFERDVLRLAYHGGTTVLAPVEDLGRVWRYGSEPDAVTLDRIGADAWRKRRAEVSAQIDETAQRLVVLTRERDEAAADPVTPPAAAYAAFASRFPFPESPDQTAAIAGVLDDLASGRPMNRLVCGDVGFGKTEVALRAAAAVALAGRQVMVAAPTTVLARQHYETFRRRFKEIGIEVAHLSRLVDGAEAKAVKAGLADGSVRVVVGTQTLAGDTITFADLGLVVIDEEQRFGAKMKDALRAQAPHALTMTATPIPKTLQSALVGLLDVSVIASPPARRRPIRTALAAFDAASLRTALLREKRRRGQAFVVCPRIEDLEPMQARLQTLVPELSVTVAHGKMSPAEVDDAMVGFAEGRGDILLATNIIESGLDVPRANTMVVWRPDRFGLAQLHQLRGRVGRGRMQGFAFLLTDPEDEVSDSTRARLSALEAFDRLGSGFAISARDLDMRGGGDLVGDDQAGHMRMIGAALYQQVLERAVRLARGEEAIPPPAPLKVDETAFIPEAFIPDATLRINLYARLSQVTSPAAVDALEDEIADRFGPPPPEVVKLLGAARIGAMAAEAGVTAIASGPKATAFTLARAQAVRLRESLPAEGFGRWSEDRLVFDADDTPHDEAFVTSILTRLAA